MTKLSDWDRWWLDLTKKVASKSKDPSTKVGCCLVDEKNRLISIGYNGLPRGIADTPERLNDRAFKLAATIHAEENAILFAQRDLTGCTAYVWPLPTCIGCTAKLIQVGIGRVVYTFGPTSNSYERWKSHVPAMLEMYQEAGVMLDFEEERSPTTGISWTEIA